MLSCLAFNPASFVRLYRSKEEFTDSMATPNGNVSADGHHVGKVVQIIGPVLDVEFHGRLSPANLPGAARRLRRVRRADSDRRYCRSAATSR